MTTAVRARAYVRSCDTITTTRTGRPSALPALPPLASARSSRRPSTPYANDMLYWQCGRALASTTQGSSVAPVDSKHADRLPLGLRDDEEG